MKRLNYIAYRQFIQRVANTKTTFIVLPQRQTEINTFLYTTLLWKIELNRKKKRLKYYLSNTHKLWRRKIQINSQSFEKHYNPVTDRLGLCLWAVIWVEMNLGQTSTWFWIKFYKTNSFFNLSLWLPCHCFDVNSRAFTRRNHHQSSKDFSNLFPKTS